MIYFLKNGWDNVKCVYFLGSKRINIKVLSTRSHNEFKWNYFIIFFLNFKKLKKKYINLDIVYETQ